MRKSLLFRKTVYVFLVISLVIAGLFGTMHNTLSSSADALIASQAVSHEPKPASMKVKKVELDSPTLTLLDSSKDEEAAFQLAPNASVRLNGELAQLSDLHPDDQIYVQRNSHGLITDIDAHRKFSGTVVSHEGDTFVVTSLFSHITGQPFQLGTYVLFAVLCGSSSYIAVPAIQRLAIPEASPTLPLAASLGLTFTYNVTIGIPLYLAISEAVLRTFPVF